MTASDESPREGHESIGFEHPGELEDETDRELALLIEEQLDSLRRSSEEVNRSLLNDSEPLTDEQVARLWDIAERLRAISSALVLRVPEEHRIGEQ